ncbi:MAG: hypothetical protein JNK14_06405 [Chitinophagaceae bacterium]|nr:hypothetical protein [Chitinophagaceae bacterium]
MKQFFLCLTAAFVLAACNDEKKTDTAGGETKTDKSAVTLPYTAAYSSSFEPGNPAYSAMILQGSWKDWEENKLDNMKNWIADTIVAFHSDNSMVVGADSMMARWKRGRAGYTSVIDTVHAVIATYSTDKKENWVLVWAKEINTDSKGKIDTTELMETWRINKDGKADMLLQYDRHTRKK